MKFIAVLLLVVILSVRPGASGASPDFSADRSVDIVDVLPFAGGDNVRIEVTLQSSMTGTTQGIELKASINPYPGGKSLWIGTLGKLDLVGGEEKTLSKHITDLKPILWSPTSPQLYTLYVTAVSAGRTLARANKRFGFRSVETRDGKIYLNGKPIFLRGHAINPPGRGVPDEVAQSREFVEAYIRDMKARNINLIRPGKTYSETWMEVCDELGMMMFSGRYGAPPAGEHNKPPEDFDESIRGYKSILRQFQRHPSVIISILTNEMAQRGESGAACDAYLEKAWRVLREWDPNRLYIGNAGFGRGHGGELYDVHPYWGWYGGSILDVYRFREPYWNPAARPQQPVTVTECIGAYATDKGHFRLDKKQLPVSLAWVGHAPNQDAAALEYQALLTGHYVEIFRRLRDLSPTLAGIMPFSRTFVLEDVSSFAEVKAKPAADQLRVSLQPVLLSWENWTPHIYSGTEARIRAHIVNDSDEMKDLRGANLVYKLQNSDDEVVDSGTLPLPDVLYYETRSIPVAVYVPETLTTGEYKLVGEVTLENRVISSNTTTLFIAERKWSKVQDSHPLLDCNGRRIFLYDPVGRTSAALRNLGINMQCYKELPVLEPDSGLIIGEDCWNTSIADRVDVLRKFVQEGGRILLLKQKGVNLKFDWLPTTVTASDEQNGLWINPERPDHPVFWGIGRERLRYWNDYTDWDRTKEVKPQVYPVTSRFKLQEPVDFSSLAVLADFGRSLSNIALCEIFDGKGSVVMCGFDLTSRSGHDPIADRLLSNLVIYTLTSHKHHRHPLIDSPIRWGDYGSERGVVTGPFHGLLDNYEDLEARIPGIGRRPGTDGGRRPFGWYDFGGGTGTYVVDRNPDSETASGVFCATIPAGRKKVVTLVANPEETPGTLELEINGARSGEAATIPAGKVVTINNPLPPDVTDVCVKYSGHKSLVLLETSFE